MVFPNVILLAGSSLVIFLSSIFVSAVTLLFFKIPVNTFSFYLGAIVVCFYLAYIPGFDMKERQKALIILFFTLLLSSFASFFFDVSWDGQNYHQEAIIRLAHGWNPVYETLKPVDGIERQIFLWDKHYPKAHYIVQAVFYALTNRIETGKTVNLLWMFASFYLATHCFLTVGTMSRNRAYLFGVLAALNPVVIYQSLSFCIDGQLASVMLCCLAALYIFARKQDAFSTSIVVATSVYFLNIKFTAVFYFVIMCAGFITLTLADRNWTLLRRSWSVLAGSFLIGILVFGYNPYVTNYKDKGHLFYPLMGAGSVDILKRERPPALKEASELERFFVSIFSETTEFKEEPLKLKFPMAISRREISKLGYPSPRMGGFGPFFSAIFLLGAFFCAMGLRSLKKYRTFYLVVLFLAVSVAINPENWWARYVPQLWLIPVLTAAYFENEQKQRWAKRLMTAMIALVMLNTMLISVYYLYRQTRNTMLIQDQLKELAQHPMPLQINFSYFPSNRVRLEEHGLKYEKHGSLSGKPILYLYSSVAEVLNTG